MDVPFVSSGAMSRAHYALVRNVETATSPQSVDRIISSEVAAIHDRLIHSVLDLKQVKECLILLLYCSMNVTAGAPLNLEFALPHAVNLAEAGQTVQQKRTGYLFCIEMMPRDHELQLMLVNTLRKDLENPAIPRICLALDTIIQSPSEDVIPAVQDRLYELLSHNSLHVRRRALHACRVLAGRNPDILKQVSEKAYKRLADPEPTVVSAALSICADHLAANSSSADRYRKTVHSLLVDTWQSGGANPKPYLLLSRIIRAIGTTKLSSRQTRLLLEIVRVCSREGPSAYAVIYQCFSLAAAVDLDVLQAAQIAAGTTFVHNIRNLLTSAELNDVYMFICCLLCIEPKLWAGTSEAVPAVLQEWEVERVMKLLDSSDRLIRRKTLQVLYRVDHNIVETYYTQLLQGSAFPSSEDVEDEIPKRLLEVVDIFCGENGELYLQHLKNVLQKLGDDPTQNKQRVLQGVIEDVLTSVRSAGVNFRVGFLGVLFALFSEPNTEAGPTFMVIVTALVCEYLDSSPMPPSTLLLGLAQRLPLYTLAIQDACLLSMMRITAICDEIPASVIEIVKKVQEQGGRHIKKRCDQYITLSQSAGALRQILSRAKSNSLPDFLISLETYEAEKTIEANRSPSMSSVSLLERPSSHTSQTPHKLRYAAYDPPKAVPRLRRQSSSSSRSTVASDDGASRNAAHGREYDEALANTVTPGDLALAAGGNELQEVAQGSWSPKSALASPPSLQIIDEDVLTSRVDLIALDSPFIPDPLASASSSVMEPDFEGKWISLADANMRGWCEASIDVVVRKLQGMQHQMRVIAADRPPFEGDLKIIIAMDEKSLGTAAAVLRLRESDDESCLWHLRCGNEELRASIRAALTDA